MSSRSKLLSCLISALIFNSFCYCMEKKVPKDVPDIPKKTVIDSIKKTLGFKTTEEKAQKKLETTSSKSPEAQRKLAEIEQKKLTAAQEQLQQAKQKLEEARTKDAAMENTFGFKIKSFFGLTSSQKAQAKVNAAKAKLASKTTRLQVYSKGLGLPTGDAQLKEEEAKKTEAAKLNPLDLMNAMNELGGLSRANFRSAPGLEEAAAKFSAAAAKEKDPTKKRQLEVYAIRLAEDAKKAAATSSDIAPIPVPVKDSKQKHGAIPTQNPATRVAENEPTREIKVSEILQSLEPKYGEVEATKMRSEATKLSSLDLMNAMNELGSLSRANFRSVPGLEEAAAKFSAAAAKEKDPTKKRQLEIYAIRLAEDAKKAAASKEKTTSSPQPKLPTLAQAEQAKKLIADAQASRAIAEKFNRNSSLQRDGIPALRDLDEKIKAIKATGNDSAELRELVTAKTKLETAILDSAIEKLVTKPKNAQGIDLYVMDSMTRVSTAVEALKILRSFETEEGKKALDANPTLRKLYEELSQKEQQLVTEAERHRAAAEAEAKKTGAPAWKTNVVEEYRKQIELSRKVAKSSTAKESEKKAPGKTVAQLETSPALTRETLSPKTSAAEVVKNILGVSEEEFVRMPPQERAKYLTFEMINGQKVWFLKDPNNPNAPKVRVGTYTQPTGADLEDRVAKRKAELQGQPRKGTSFSIVYQSAGDGLQHVDTGNMQADPAYRDALFMVASNFSGLETLREGDTNPGEAKKISDYVRDRTQGPSAAMSTAAGTVFRTYFANCERYPNDPSKWPQAVGDTTRETNYLSGAGIETRNGYVTEAGARNIDRLAASDAFSRFSYGFQDGTQVTHTGLVDGSSHQRLNDPEQKVSQMYVAALDLQQATSPLAIKLRDPNTPAAEKQKIIDAAQRTLEMSYDAIIKEAFARGKTKIVLTRIGGGAFGNSPEMIDAAIKSALEKNKDLLEMGGIHVTLNAFGQPNEAMKELNARLGGTITEFGNGKKVETTVEGK